MYRMEDAVDGDHEWRRVEAVLEGEQRSVTEKPVISKRPWRSQVVLMPAGITDSRIRIPEWGTLGYGCGVRVAERVDLVSPNGTVVLVFALRYLQWSDADVEQILWSAGAVFS